MACPTQLHRRLLCLVIRAPSLSQQPPPLKLSSSKVRPYHRTKSLQADGFSITFGPQIDSLLKSSKSALKEKSQKKNSKKASGRGAVSSRPSKSTSPREPAATKSASNIHYNVDDMPLRVKADRVVTLDESEDAYATTYKPETTSDRLTTPPSNRTGQEKGNARKWVKSKAINSQGKPYQTLATARVSTEAKQHQGTIGERSHLPTEPVQTYEKPSNSTSIFARQPRKKSEPWQVQKDALQRKFGDEAWNPRKRLSPDALEGIRSLHEEDPNRYSTEILSQQFKVSPEAIRRILKSKWRPAPEVMEDRRERWARRHDRIWDQKAALGLRPPRTRDREPEGPEAFEEEVYAKQMLGQI